tara:strand:- start:1197 stop:2879 length:1683 start_codon:yes stop_codon:yes gene_type:complete
MAVNKEEDQMIMAFMVDDGKDVDPVSGNEVPPGSLAKEVRDDIPAQLSEGEYVVPADVLRFYGMKFFEDLRENAKIELARMEAEGRIGGQPVDAAVGGYMTGQPTQSTTPDPYEQQRMMYRQGAPVAMGNAGYFPGGTVGSSILSPTFNPGNPAGNAANTNINTNIPEPIVEDGITYMPPSNYYVGSTLFGSAPSLKPPFTPVTLYGPNGEIVTANTQAEYDNYISQDYKTTQTVTEEPTVTGSDNDDINQEVANLTTIEQQAERDAYAEKFESALAGTASEQDYINIYGNLASQQATLTGMAGMNPLVAPVILKTIADKKKLNAALEKKYGADWKTDPKYSDLAAKFKEIDEMSMADRLKAGFGQFKKNMSEIFKDKEEEKYVPQYSVYGLSMGGPQPTVQDLSDKIGFDISDTSLNSNGHVTLLSEQEQRNFDAAVRMGNGSVARHYAIINASRVKRLLRDGLKEGLTDSEREKLGLDKDPDPVITPVQPETEASSDDDPPAQIYTPEETQAFRDQTEGTFKSVDELDKEEKEIYPGGIGINKGGLIDRPKKKKKNKK